jgi:hypothetical protein
MEFEAEVIQTISEDPYYKIKFSYKTEEIEIKRGFAEVFRKPPKPEIRYDVASTEKLKKCNRDKLELEILNIVIGHLLRYEFNYSCKKRLLV